LIWDHPIWSTLLAMAVYTLLAANYTPFWHATKYAYFNYLADAFLHGQLHIRIQPPSTHDLSFFGGQHYLYWPPLPAILLMPLIAIFGVDFSDIVFNTGIAGLNVGLVALLLRQASARGIIDLSSVQRGLLVVFFAFGTVHLALTPFGGVWFTGQLIGFACVALAYLAAISLHGLPAFVLTSLALAAALLTRNHLVLAGLWPAYYLLKQHWSVNWQRLAGYIIVGTIPIVCAIALLGLYNWLRFGDPLDNGLAYHQMADIFVEDYQRYGAFSLHFVPTNLYYQYVAYPLPFNSESVMGGSLFLLSPVFFGALWGIVVGHHRLSSLLLAATILLVALPILLLMGTGWIQWGPRYTLDFTVPLMLLTAIGTRRWPVPLLLLLIAVSIFHYTIGTIYLTDIINK
jgi:hypothetical protein